MPAWTSTCASWRETGAEGIGLFRTEFQFMVAEEMPRLSAQTALYARGAWTRPAACR